jgi:hypothetical protein
MRFTRFVGIDWSGALGPVLKGVQIAVCRPGRAAPELVMPPDGRAWRRSQVFDWLERALPGTRTLVGLDFSFTLPFADQGAYFPGVAASPAKAPALWALVEEVCHGDPEFYGGSFVAEAPWRSFFKRPGRTGRHFTRRHKAVERRCAEQGMGVPESVFHLIGPKQVGLGSLAGMRLLLALRRAIPALAIWPIVDTAAQGPVAAEVFPRLFLECAGHGGGKVRNVRELNRVLRALASLPSGSRRVTDDEADALVTSAGLRAIAGAPATWRPAGLTRAIARTEGWILGVG